MKVGSLFSGIGGLDLGLEQAGHQIVWQCEIDTDCRRILAEHWPDVPCYEDVTQVDWSQVEPVDLVCGGFPCQDVSVAGRRAGLAGSRSGLWWQFRRAIAELHPEWVLIENVPGLLSSNDGADIEVILTELEDLGYIIDMDVLDAQNFGVAQRRRRVFIVCQSVDFLLRQKTTTSALTIAQCLSEILECILVGARRQSVTDWLDWDFGNGAPDRSLQRRMRLFGLDEAGQSERLLPILDAFPLSCPGELGDSASSHGSNGTDISPPLEDIWCELLSDEPASTNGSLNIRPSWRNILDVVLKAAKEFTTSTSVNRTTESTIFTCAQTLLLIAASIGRSTGSSPPFWTAALSASTAVRSVTNYARTVSGSLFTELGWLQPWSDFLDEAERLHQSLGGSGDWTSSPPLLSLRESGCGDPAPRRQTGTRVAANLTAGTSASRGVNEVHAVGSLMAGSGRGWRIGADEAAAGQLIPAVAPTLESGTNRTDGTRPPGSTVDTAESLIPFHVTQDPITGPVFPAMGAGNQQGCATLGVAYPIQDGRDIDKAQNGLGVGGGSEPSYTVDTTGAAAVAQLTGGGGKPGQGYPAVRDSMQVRRLTPLECERLQGFPDDWTEGLSDSARYRCLGNAVTVPMAAWIGAQLLEVCRARSA